jgi:hypothetical protein
MGGSRDIHGEEYGVGWLVKNCFTICTEIFPEYFVIKILKSADDRADKWKLSLESKIFIALVRSL